MAQPLPWQREAARDAYVQHLRVIREIDREIAGYLRDAAIFAEREARKLSGATNVGARVRRAQLQNFSAAIRQQQITLWGDISQSTRRGVRRATREAIQGNIFLAEYLTRAGASQQLSRQFVSAARAAMENVRAKYINDIQLSELVYKNQQRGIARVQRIVRQGLGSGLSARELAGKVRHLISPSTPGGVSYSANRLARTEINNAFHTVNTQIHDQSPFVTGVKWNLSSSHPRPDECDDYAEKDDYNLGEGVWKPQDVPFKPHPHCLCYTTAITVKTEEFKRSLESGEYNRWLVENGQAPI